VSERTNSYAVPWSRLLVEGVVIVLSILLAFAVDAAWDRSRDAAAERIVLGDLRSELTENREAIENRWLPNHLATAVAHGESTTCAAWSERRATDAGSSGRRSG
jgi:hypothetical protein